MSKNFKFTKEFDVSSSLIDEVWYNENDDSVVLDVNNYLYRYTGVSSADVSALVRGGDTGSVGHHYNTVFKKEFGPGENLGFWSDVDEVHVPVEKDQSVPTTPKNLFDASDVSNVRTLNVVNSQGQRTNFNGDVLEDTKEYSLNSEPSVSVASPVGDTREFSLSFDEDDAPLASEAEGIEGVREIVVHFTLNDYDNKFKFKAVNSSTVEDAIEELNDYVSLMGAKGRVSKVVVKFE